MTDFLISGAKCYNKAEAGKNQNPTLDTLKKIAKALDIIVDDLMN
ncbi:MAG: helix-turn-helix transcriptional regulator [Candidatus Jorgensenbacteria bacterium]